MTLEAPCILSSEYFQAELHSGYHLLPAIQNITKVTSRETYRHLYAHKGIAINIETYFSAFSLDIHYDYQDNAICKYSLPTFVIEILESKYKYLIIDSKNLFHKAVSLQRDKRKVC